MNILGDMILENTKTLNIVDSRFSVDYLPMVFFCTHSRKKHCYMGQVGKREQLGVCCTQVLDHLDLLGKTEEAQGRGTTEHKQKMRFLKTVYKCLRAHTNKNFLGKKASQGFWLEKILKSELCWIINEPNCFYFFFPFSSLIQEIFRVTFSALGIYELALKHHLSYHPIKWTRCSGTKLNFWYILTVVTWGHFDGAVQVLAVNDIPNAL